MVTRNVCRHNYCLIFLKATNFEVGLSGLPSTLHDLFLETTNTEESGFLNPDFSKFLITEPNISLGFVTLIQKNQTNFFHFPLRFEKSV